MATLELSQVVKTFDKTTTIHGVDLQIADGEFVVFVGPSGCGKSTLLRIISGLESATSGEIRIDGKRVNEVTAAHRGCSMVFQSYALYPHMSVYDNMAFGLENLGVAKADIASKVGAAAKLLQLDALLQRKPTQLSGGQRQRVAIGRSIVREPKLFLFDEPLSNLDAELRVSMRAEIRDLHARLKATMIYVTHDQVEAMTMADKIVVMRAGTVEQIGRPLELYDRPANTFVATFIGSPSMNLIDGRVDAGRFVTATGLALPCPALPAGARTWGIRPEHVVLADDGLPAEVQTVEPMGAETHVMVRLGGAAAVVAVRDRIEIKPGDIVHLKPNLACVHLFDEAGRRIDVAGSSQG